MKIIDLHCDVLYQLVKEERAYTFSNDPTLQAGLIHLKQGKVKVQVFAIFIDEDIPQNQRYTEAMKQIEKFQTEVLSVPEMVHITNWQQLANLEEDQIGAILSLEGCDAIGEDMFKLDTFIQAGVKLVGLTWNWENGVAYGAQEDAQKGLKPFGIEVVKKLNDHNIIVDVSHLNEQGFWDLMPIVKHVIASHSNARSLCNHPRNLTDEQAKALVAKGGRIHLVYNPPFIKEGGTTDVTIKQFVEHFTHFSNLVGIENIGLGSDFDGIEHTVKALSNATETQNLVAVLAHVFGQARAEQIAFKNFETYINKMK